MHVTCQLLFYAFYVLVSLTIFYNILILNTHFARYLFPPKFHYTHTQKIFFSGGYSNVTVRAKVAINIITTFH